jgi:hypothetical protein
MDAKFPELLESPKKHKTKFKTETESKNGPESKTETESKGNVSAVVLPQEERYAAIIEISEFGESPSAAIKSIVANPGYFKEVHLVQHGYSSSNVPYYAWPSDIKALTALGLAPVWHARLDTDKVRAGAAVYIQPDAQVADGALSMLHEDMVYGAKNAKNQTHFAVTPITSIRLDRDKRRDPLEWILTLVDVMSYGFLLVVMMVDWGRSLFNGYKYHPTFNLRAVCLFTTYPQRVQQAPTRFSWWLWNPNQCRAKSGGSALLHIPKGKNTGLSFVLRTIKTHQMLGYGAWVFGFIFYYWLFAWPWWNGLAFKGGPWGILQLLTRNPWGILQLLTRNPWAWYWQTVMVLHTLVVAIVAWTCMELPLGLLPLQVLLYTFYLTLAPLLLVYGRFHVSRASWVHFGEAKKRNNKKKKK